MGHHRPTDESKQPTTFVSLFLRKHAKLTSHPASQIKMCLWDFISRRTNAT